MTSLYFNRAITGTVRSAIRSELFAKSIFLLENSNVWILSHSWVSIFWRKTSVNLWWYFVCSIFLHFVMTVKLFLYC